MPATEAATSTEVRYLSIPNFPGYRIGSDGSLWSCRTKGGNTGNKWRKAQPNKRKCGHLFTGLHNKGVYRVVAIHTLVLEAFCGPRPSGFHCRHLNGVSDDNRLENLAWGTPKENAEDQVKHGVMIRGERVGISKLNENKVREIRKLLLAGDSKLSISRKYGVRDGTIHFIAKGKTWRHVS